MLRAQYERHGPVPEEVIHPVEFEVPRLEAGQALVEVIAAPVNPADLLVLAGEHGQLPPLPAIGGREGVGRLAQLAAGTRGPEVGQLVLLPFGCGSWSAHVVVEAAGLVSLPEQFFERVRRVRKNSSHAHSLLSFLQRAMTMAFTLGHPRGRSAFESA